MTHEDYLKLIQGSEAFKSLDAPTQQKIKVATGAEMEKFGAIMVEERDLILAAKKELLERNDQVLKDMGADMKKLQKNYLKEAEAITQKTDAQGLENLMKTL